MSDLRIHPNAILACCGSITGMLGEETYQDRHAADCGAPVCFRVFLPRQLGTKSGALILTRDADGQEKHFPLVWEGIRGQDDTYTVTLDTSWTAGLCFFSFRIFSVTGIIFGRRKSDNRIFFTFDRGNPRDGFHLLLTETSANDPRWLYGGVIYQIFVDRFRRGKETVIPDGMEFEPDWNSRNLEFPDYPGAPMKNNRVYGGNLSGITEKLDYLASLHVNLLYLTPIFSSPSNHKYDTADYMKIDPLFGDEAALCDLIREAGKRGIRILLDGVFNHTGADSIYFNRYGRYPLVGACQGEKSPYYRWYRFRHYPNEYECWWNIPILPRIHPEEPSCRAYFAGENGVVAHYASLGIGGFRLDVADELPDDFIAEIKARLSEADPESVLFGEVWEDASDKIAYGKRKQYYAGRELDGVMNYPFRDGVIRFLRDGNPDALRYYFDSVLPNMPRRNRDAAMNLIGTHDTPRAMTALAGMPPEGKKNSELNETVMTESEYALGRSLLRLAYLIASTVPGLPMIYYGDEAGMHGYSDPFNRCPYPWGREDAELLWFYTEVGEMRQRHSCYQRGGFRLLLLDESLLVFARYDQNSVCVTVVNRSQTTFRIAFDDQIRVIYGGRSQNRQIVLNPISGCVLTFRKTPERIGFTVK